MAAEMHSVRLGGTTSATTRCDDCTFHGDAFDVARVQTILADAAMHAMAEGHTVQEHITRSVTVSPEALCPAAGISYSV